MVGSSHGNPTIPRFFTRSSRVETIAGVEAVIGTEECLRG